MIRTVSRNAASSWVAVAVQVAVVFFLTPFILSSLGPARYGVWALVTGLTGYYGLLEFGFRAGITQYLTRYLATRSFAKMNATASTGFLAMVCCGCLVAIVTLLAAWLAPVVFQLPTDVVVETQLCILAIGLSTAVTFPLYPFSAVFPATQRFDISNGVVIGTYLLSAGATFVALKLGYGLVTLSIISGAGSLVLYGSLWRLAYRVLPELQISRRLAGRSDFWPIIRYGGWSFFINGATIVKSRVDVILIGLFLPIEAIAPYALALSMTAYFDRLFVPVGHVLFPAVTSLDARGEVLRLREVYLRGSKLLMLLAIAVGVFSAVWAADFFRLWIATDITGAGTYPSPATLYCILVVPAACAASQYLSGSVCGATRRLRPLAAIAVTEAIVKVCLSVFLVGRFGLIGIAVGTLLPAIVFQLIVLPANVHRIIGVKMSDYVRTTWSRPMLTLVALLGLLVPILHVVSGVTGWPELVLFAAATGLVVSMAVALVGLEQAERRRFVLEPVLHVGRRMGWLKEG